MVKSSSLNSTFHGFRIVFLCREGAGRERRGQDDHERLSERQRELGERGLLLHSPVLRQVERLDGWRVFRVSDPQPLLIRTPIVPGINDNKEEIGRIAEFVSKLPNLMYYELLPFHPMATSKYDSLDIDYRARNLQRPPVELMDDLTEHAKSYGIPARHN